MRTVIVKLGGNYQLLTLSGTSKILPKKSIVTKIYLSYISSIAISMDFRHLTIRVLSG